MKALKIILIIIGAITAIMVLAVVIFMNTASNETKEKLMRGTPLEETGIDREVYVKCDILNSRKNILGTKWIITGKFYVTSDKQNYTQQVVRFKFSDFDETRAFSYRLNGSQTFSRPFEIRIPGHNGAQFYGAEVIDAN
jgi:ABC-type lipoprotein release transport system permease subunit